MENWGRAVTGLSTTGAAQTPTISLTLALIACISASRSPARPFATPRPRLARSCAGRKILTRRKWPMHATPPKRPLSLLQFSRQHSSFHRDRTCRTASNNTTRRSRPAPTAVNFCYHRESCRPSRSGCTARRTYDPRSAARLTVRRVSSASLPSHHMHCGMLSMCSCSSLGADGGG